MPDPLQTTFDVPLDGKTYTFRIPTIKMDIEIAYKAAEVRQRAYPQGGGTLVGVDGWSSAFARFCAIMELYLVKADTLWPYGFSDDDMSAVDFNKSPKVDFEKFPVEHTETVYQMGEAFDREVARFRGRRNQP